MEFKIMLLNKMHIKFSVSCVLIILASVFVVIRSPVCLNVIHENLSLYPDGYIPIDGFKVKKPSEWAVSYREGMILDIFSEKYIQWIVPSDDKNILISFILKGDVPGFNKSVLLVRVDKKGTDLIKKIKENIEDSMNEFSTETSKIKTLKCESDINGCIFLNVSGNVIVFIPSLNLLFNYKEPIDNAGFESDIDKEIVNIVISKSP